jgi:hypothetical protein
MAAWSLYIFLKPVNQKLSLLTAWFRLIYSAIFGFALSQLLFITLLLGDAFFLEAFGLKGLDALVTLFLKGFIYSWAVGLILIGCHIFFLGYLVFKSGFIPKVLGALLMVAGLCYLTTNFATILLPGYENYKGMVEAILSLPMIIGELGFGLWLLFKGGKVIS